MAASAYLGRLAGLDTNTVSDALDLLHLPGAVVGIRPLWNCRKIVGRASTVQLGKKTGGAQTVHLITPVISKISTDDRILVVAGGLDGISCWGDLLANAASAKHIRGTVIDGWSRDIDGSERLGYPVFGRGVTMVSARNRVVQLSAGGTVKFAGVDVHEGDYLVADRCGVVFIPAARIEEIVTLGEHIDAKQTAMATAIREGIPVEKVMHDKEFDSIPGADS